MATPTMEPIATQTLTSAAIGITFSSIPQGYRDLVVTLHGVFTAGSNNEIGARINNSSAAIYDRQILYSDTSTVSSGSGQGDNYLSIAYGAGSTTNPIMFEANFMEYSNTTRYKSIISQGGTSVGNSIIVSSWGSTAAMTSLYVYSLASNFAVGSTVSIWGVH